MSHQQQLDMPYARVGVTQITTANYVSKMHDDEQTEEEKQEERRMCIRRWGYRTFFFLLGAGIALLIALLAIHFKKSGHSSSAAAWESSDYEEGFQYYAQPSITAHPIQIEDNMRLSRLGAPVLAPNGLVVVFTRTQFDQRNLNRSATSLWYYNLPYTGGYSALPLTRPIWGVHDSQPSFDSYSRVVVFLSNRVGDSSRSVGALTQIFSVNVPFPKSIDSIPLIQPVTYLGALGQFATSWMGGSAEEAQIEGEELSDSPAQRFQQRLHANTPVAAGASSLPTADSSTYIGVSQLTDYPVAVDNLLLGRNPTGDRTLIAFSARVFPNSSMAETAARIAAKQSRSGNSHVFDKLMVRHWDEWMDGTRNHIHILAIDQHDDAAIYAVSEPVDIMRDLDSDAPTRPDGSAGTQWSFSSSAYNFAFVRNTYDPYSNMSWTLNTDIYTVSIAESTFAGGPFTASLVSAPVCRTCDNLAMDSSPVYSPIAEDTFVYLSSATPGYESDRLTLKVVWNATSVPVDLTADWTYSISTAWWTSTGTGIYLGVATHGRERVALFTNIRAAGSSFDFNESVLLSDHTNGDVQVAPDDSFILYTTTSYQSPSTINVMYYNASSYNVSVGDLTAGFNELPLSKMQRSPTEEFYFPGARGDQVQSWLFRPVGFDATKTYPLAFLIHGGPQNPWSDAWSYRWNPQIYAAQGYMVAAINFHGSGSFGQEFTDSITGNYGTLPFEDLMLGLDWFLTQSPYAANIDRERLGALGASYGGYMINWIAGHQWNATHKFKALVCHDGMVDIRAFYYSTEEIYFPEHDIGLGIGGTPFTVPQNFEQFNPIAPELVSKWMTPTLVIHGGLDYRIDESQGLTAFTALQRQGIPSKFLYFPYEAHQVFNTQNQLTWHREVLGWLAQWTGGATEEVAQEAREL